MQSIMAKDFALAFYHSRRWQECRKAFIKERVALDGGVCQRCHEELGYIVHHKIHLTPGNIQEPSVALSHNNLEYVCKRCHDEEHFFPESKHLLCGFDEKGRPIVNGATEVSHKDNNKEG